MDKQGKIKEHSQEKLSLYEKYLKNYLGVLSNQGYFQRINIWDIFAGKGIDDGVLGSAIRAAEIIKTFNNKSIRLFLNERNPKYFSSLKKECEERGYLSFTNIENKRADQFFIENVSNSDSFKKGFHNFFFIDPFGYTDFSEENIKKLSSFSNVEYLIFIPTSNIVRFVKEKGGGSLAKDNPACRFLLGLGISEKSLLEVNNDKGLIDEIVDRLKKISSTDYGYSYRITNNIEKYSLFDLCFITKHFKGAEKFLDAINQIQNNMDSQLTLINEKKETLKESLERFLQEEKKSNREIYHKGLEWGYRSNEVADVLKEFEKNGEISIKSDKKRRKGSFYLKSSDNKIIVSWGKNE